MKKRIIFIPVETIARELDYKIVLASKLLSKDNIIFLGQHDFLDSIVRIFKNGMYIGKNVFKDSFPCSHDLFGRYKRKNFSIAWLHEEGGIYAGDKSNWKIVLNELLDPSVLKSDDAILTWGEFQKNHYTKKAIAKLTNVGVPRFNLSLESPLRLIINKFNRVQEKDYVLINTNFSTVNYHSDREKMLLNLTNSFIDAEENIKLVKHFVSQNKIFSHFIDLVTNLATKYPNQLFVFRPHPTESIKIYKLLFATFSNVRVSKEFSAVEWMDKSQCLIQNGCTTSLEAYFMGKKVINFFPFEDKDSINITRELGVSCTNFKEVEAAIYEEEYYDSNINNDLDELPELIGNLSPNYSEDEFINTIIKLSNKKDKFSFNYSILELKIRLIALSIKIFDAIKYMPRYFFYKTKWEDYKMAVSHFPGFSKSEIASKFDFLSDQQEHDHHLRFVEKKLVIISQKSKDD